MDENTEFYKVKKELNKNLEITNNIFINTLKEYENDKNNLNKFDKN